jgi:hypothetical protein
MHIVENFVEIILPSPDSFLKIKETLTRIGVASKRDKILYQSCHILHKQGRYYIVHFKELFMLDGKADELSDEDRARRNTIINLLEEWSLIKTVNPSAIQDPIAPLSQIKVLPFKEKGEWHLVPKYNIGSRYNS